MTFGVAFYGRALSHIDFFGWPLPFWVGAQGALITYLLIVVLYARVMNRMDRQMAEGMSDDASERHAVDLQPNAGPESK